MNALMLCPEDSLRTYLWGYGRAFPRQGVKLSFTRFGTPPNTHIRELLAECLERPDFILQPETDHPLLPLGLTEIGIPTVCFHIDTHVDTRRRIRWSKLFDVPAVFHQHYVEKYRRAGHPGAIELAHAAQQDLYDLVSRHRPLDIGWVGRTTGAPYGTRRRTFPLLAQEFRMNEWTKHYLEPEIAEVYLHSKIVVNISRDDYPEDANPRVFEAMAAGALLLASIPSNLTELGFVEGEHFAGYRSEEEIIPAVRRYLSDAPARERIAAAGRELVLARHTYDARVKSLLDFLATNGSKLPAPARRWPEAKVRLTYLDYYAGSFSLDCAHEEFGWIARHSLLDSVAGARLLARGWARQGLNRVAAWSQR
jgi:Glycosyl transferases group 1